MLVNQPALDYLRVGTWDTGMSYWWIALVPQLAQQENQECKRARLMQYKGMGCKFAFAGVAAQGPERRMHTLIQVSGERADTYWRDVFALADKGGGKATRVDLQVTVPMTYAWEPHEWAERLSREEWGHKKPSLRVVAGDDGLHTLYIGTRSSERYIRFYVKEDDTGTRYLRFEVEFTGGKAQWVWAMLQSGANIAGKILGGELRRLPLWEGDTLYRALDDALGKGNPVPTSVGAGGATWEWLLVQVDSVVRRYLADHELGGQMRRLLLEWQSYADRLDKS